MPLDTEFDAVPPSNEPVARSPAAERMRRHRRRRRNGMRCMTIELRETEIDALIRRGFLKPETRNDLSAVRESFYAYLERALGSKS
jgi:hypothetical protein